MQKKQREWHEQWTMLQCNELFLFEEWIAPYSLADFRGKEVLECGCGGGQHTDFMARYAKSVTAADLNTIDIAKQRNRHHSNIIFREADIAEMDLKKQYDIVISIGVVHHTDYPEKTVENLIRHVKPGGLLLLWVYSEEGNLPMKKIVEPLRKAFLRSVDRKTLLRISEILTFMMYFPVFSVYLLPFPSLPYYEYFQNFRKLSYKRNVLNVFDKLNAPQTDFISQSRAEDFVRNLKNAKVLPYKGVSWRISGVKIF